MSDGTAVDHIFEVRDLTVRFGGVVALDSVSFQVQRGTIHSLIGPNGAGKSTCLNAVTGVYGVDAGRVIIDGRDVTGSSPPDIVELGVARTFQNLVLPPGISVYDSIRMGRHRCTRTGFLAAGLALRASRAERRRDDAVVREMAQLVGLGNRLGAIVDSLDYGSRKRIELARALCAEPSLLILDEPAAGMNAAETADVGDLIDHCKRELALTVLLIEHDMSLVMSRSDHVTVLQSGRVIASGDPLTVQRDEAVIAAYLGRPDVDGLGIGSLAAESTTAEPTTAESTTAESTTAESTTAESTTAEPTTAEPTTGGQP